MKAIGFMLVFCFHKYKYEVLICRVLLKKSGSRTPRIELEEIGPSFDLVMRRTKLASEDLYKRSLKQPKTIKVI